jgi:monoamine oxidase
MAETKEKIAIVGGGIAGLFCALILRQRNMSVSLFETADRLGGRIRTIRLNKHNEEMDKTTWKADDLEFYVEFGPMRVELDKQLLLNALLRHLGIKAIPTREEGLDAAHLVEFPSYSSPASSHDPKYDLRPEEIGKTPLELLRLALMRVLVHLDVSQGSSFASKKEALIKRITLAAATQESVDRIFTEWMQKELQQEDYWEIQTQGRIADVPLCAMGFWNLLSDFLSHDAILKLRDLGTFYHLLPENPNAAEWLVWWLLGFGTHERLHGIFGGMECIVDKLENELKGKNAGLFPNCWVKKIEYAGNKLKLEFDETKRPRSDIEQQEYDRVILALPRGALQDIERRSTEVFKGETGIEGLLDSAFGFPMVKTFVVVKNRWWEEENLANQFATRVPTRELHYWKGHTKDSKQGLIMAYTDRPASSFWANYVPSGPQIDAHRTNEKMLSENFRNRLTKKVAQYLSENNLPDIKPEDLVWYGIRDWGREPYSGANHAWRPERKYWVVIRRLAEIALPDSGTDHPTLHICGEAYSDYHGFMEGSLRSAAYVLHRILDKKAGGKFDRLPWLLEEDGSDLDKEGLRVQRAYLRALRKWAESLDSLEATESYLVE